MTHKPKARGRMKCTVKSKGSCYDGVAMRAKRNGGVLIANLHVQSPMG